MAIFLEGFRELSDALGASEYQLERAFRNVLYAFSSEAQQVIANNLIQAAAQAGPDAFPLQYVSPMIDAAKEVVVLNLNEVILDFERLGTMDDLEQGYHYKARIDNESHVELPYQGEDLKNEVDRRYEFWLRVFHGESYNNFDYAGAWSETIAARLAVWGNKAPQWLLLEYGQEEWDPTIEPYPIVEDVTVELYSLFETMLKSEVQYILDHLNRPVPTIPTGAAYDIRGRGSRVRDLTSGRFITESE